MALDLLIRGGTVITPQGAGPWDVGIVDERIAVLVQVETGQALAHLDAIAAVDGVDGVFIGPADLSASMGYLGQPAHSEVRSVIDDAIRRIVAAGKAAGILCADETLARHYIEVGASFVAIGVETTLLVKAASGLLGRFREAAPAAPESAAY